MSTQVSYDAWGLLPASARAAMVARGKDSWRFVYDGVATHNKVWRPLRPPVMTPAAYDELTGVSARLGRMILAACRRRAADAGELRRALGLPLGTIDLMSEEQPLTEELIAGIRVDFLISGGVPRVVEANIDSALGGAFDSDGVARRFLASYAGDPALMGLHITPPPSAVDARYEAMRTGLGLTETTRTVMLFSNQSTYPDSQDSHKMIALLEPFVARGRELGIDIVVRPVQWLTNDHDRRLLVDDVPVEAVLRMFIPQDTPPGSGLTALGIALRAGTVKMFTPSASWLLASKSILAWLWQDLELLSPDDAAALRAHIPRTWVVTAAVAEQVVSQREYLVLKPSGSYGGTGVVIGPHVTPEAWEEALRLAVKQGGHVLQEFVETDRLTMQFIEIATGDVREADVPFCVAPYIFGAEPAGAYLRFAVPDAGAVVNVGQGALTSGLLLVER